MEKKSYSKPIMTAEAFEPQEYCDVCWIASVTCLGESSSQGQNLRYISFPPSGTEYDMHWHGHTAHDVIYYLRMPDGVTPTVADIENVIEIETEGQNINDIELAHGRSSSSHQAYEGWGWLNSDGHVHFTYDPEFQLFSPRPNHS